MHLLWESSNWPGSTVEPAMVWLSWLSVSSKVSTESMSQNGASGFLACGSQSGAVGITATDAHVRLSTLDTKRLNFNLRGHHSPVCRVSWNQQQQKLASCDESGIIYVWARYEDRWSVELVNDRGIRVRDFSWSSNGNFALICYLDNFVLVGSAAGQRVWSTTFENHSVLCGTWEPTTKRVVLGTADGLLLLVSEDGNLLSEHEVLRQHPVEHLEWSCVRSSDNKSSLCLVFRTGLVYLMDGCDDAGPTMIKTNLDVVHMQWSTSGEYLAVVGTRNNPVDNSSHLHIYSHDGSRLFGERIPGDEKGHVSGFTWGHNDQIVFVSVGGLLNVGRVHWDTPSLKTLSSLIVFRAIDEQLDLVDELPLPLNDKAIIKSHGSHVVECRIPNARELCQAVCRPSTSRYYCSIRPAPGQAAHTWELCCEHAGGLVPILGACVTNKLRPEFEIWLGSAANSPKKDAVTPVSRSAAPSPPLSSVEGSVVSRGGFQRDSMWRRSKRQLQAMVQRAQQSLVNTPKVRKKLALVTSNVWCTRFKIVGLDSEFLAPYMGEVTYKTSVLHLQPRQMTVQLVDLNRSFTCGLPPLPPLTNDNETADSAADENLMAYVGEGPPVAPMPAEIFSSTVHRVSTTSFVNQTPVNNQNLSTNVVSDDDTEFPYVDLSSTSDFLFSEEGQLLKQLIDEFGELKQAADKHIKKMRHFAQDLQTKSRVLNVTSTDRTRPEPISAVAATTPTQSALASVDSVEMPSTSDAQSIAAKDNPNEKKISASDGWWEQVNEQLDFIDEDESLVITNETEKRRLQARSLSLAGLPESELGSNSVSQNTENRPMSACAMHVSTETSASAAAFNKIETDSRCAVVRGGACRQLREVSTVLEKLCKLASDLAPKHVQDQTYAGHVFSSNNSKISPNQSSKPALTMDSGDTGPYAQMFQRFHEVSQRVVQLENLLSYGSELLDEVRYDLLERVQRIRTVLDSTPRTIEDQQTPQSHKANEKSSSKRFLGKPEHHLDVSNSPSGSAISTSQGNQGEILTLQNKTPFWNEAVQVYQLDFGGRVTQESAKNFQIEYQNKQVMQFGRIENGGYTLDFEAPFTAVQAFAVALASITQRFK